MKSTKKVYSGVSAGAYPWIPLDHNIQTQDIQWAVWKVGAGTDLAARVEYTLDNVAFPVSGQETSALAITVATFAASAAGLVTAANINHVQAAIRLVVVSVSGASDLVFQVQQAGPR